MRTKRMCTPFITIFAEDLIKLTKYGTIGKLRQNGF